MKLLEDIRDVLKAVKHRKPSTIYCPRCASQRIHIFSSLNYGIMPRKYLCENCGYVGPIVMELEKEKDE